MKTANFKLWNRKKDTGIFKLNIVRVFLVLILINFGISVVKGIFSGGVSTLIALCLCGGVLLIYESYKQNLDKDYIAFTEDDMCQPCDFSKMPNLEVVKDQILSELNISEPIDFYINCALYDSSPYVLTYKKANYIILPLGFFKLLRQNFDMAKAILTHEMGHIAQRDADLTHLCKTYLKYVVRIILPIQLIFGAPTMYFSYQAMQEAKEESADQYDAVFGDQASASYHYDEMQEESGRYNSYALIFYSGIFSICFYLIFYAFLVHLSYQSEKNADLAACIMTSPKLVNEAISTVTGNDVKRRYRLITINPTTTWRLNRVKNYL